MLKQPTIYPIGTRVKLHNGELATIIFSNDCRVRVKLDKRKRDEFTTGKGETVVVQRSIEKDLSPDSEFTLTGEEVKIDDESTME